MSERIKVVDALFSASVSLFLYIKTNNAEKENKFFLLQMML
jgi:hypothetical protein